MGWLSKAVKIGTLGLIDPDEGKDAAKRASRAQVAATDRASEIQRDMFERNRRDLAPGRAVGTNALLSLASAMGQAPSLEQIGLTMGLDNDQMRQLLGSAYRGGEPTNKHVAQPTNPLADTPYSGAFSKIIAQLRAQQANRPATSNTQIDPDVELARSLYGQLQSGPSSLSEMVESDPGYQFRMDQGTKAIERSAAARGGLFSGKTGKDLTRFSQGLASQETSNAFNRLAALAGIGQQNTNAMVSLGQNTASNLSNLATQAGNARASGYIGAFNADPLSANNLMKLGTQIGSAAMMGSDIAIKENLSFRGHTESGLPVYLYNYKGSPEQFIGVMAQDVEKLIPDAVVEINGIKHVDYSKVH